MTSPRLLALPLLALGLLACTKLDGISTPDDEAAPDRDRVEVGESASTKQAPIEIDLEAPGPIELETVVSARWAVPSAGLVNLHHPKAQAAGLRNETTSIVVSVHVLRHPSAGLWAVDTGVPRGGPRSGVEGVVVNQLLANMESVEPIADIVARHQAPLAGVFFTHMHIDHVLGLPDIPKGTPLFAGPNEMDIRAIEKAALGRSFDRLLAGHDVRSFDLKKARPLGSLPAVLDVFEDGSLFAIHVPGHTHGSMAYLARTKTGPVLLAGDVSHTIWGWENGVEPGLFSTDGDENAKSLALLKSFAAAHPEMKVFVGHETDGKGTGIHPR